MTSYRIPSPDTGGRTEPPGGTPNRARRSARRAAVPALATLQLVAAIGCGGGGEGGDRAGKVRA
ncbi:hypothetical protein, partial [Streptomyces sp. NPDC058953]|uniref:hypothetical protein n=1 Tax=Streptomyces sp. NPDC058953 TaxID=3346676 RepID=UPI0036C2F644